LRVFKNTWFGRFARKEKISALPKVNLATFVLMKRNNLKTVNLKR